MKPIYIALLLSILTMSSKNYGQEELPVLEGPYLGQKPPGLTPEVFAPGIVSTEHRDLGSFFTPDLKEFYFTRKDNATEKWSLVVFKSENNRWRKFSSDRGLGPPFFSPDGKIIHFGNRFKVRTDTGWSEIKSLGPPFDDIPIMRLTSSLKETYVLDEATEDGSGVIRYSRLIAGIREAPMPFGKEINSGKWNAHPFIAPDESYIIWDGVRDSGFGNSDLYVSFKQQDDSWGSAINLGDKINTSSVEAGGYVTPDGKYLFFSSHISPGNGDIFWVDAKIIDNLRSNK